MQMLCNCKASQFVGMTISDAMAILDLFEDDDNFDFWDLPQSQGGFFFFFEKK